MPRSTRRAFLKGLGLGAGALAASCRHRPIPKDAPCPRPNVIVIITDDQGYGDVGVHGNDIIQTPHLDRFAQSGILFSRFYCSPVCAPTRASLMTGRHHYRTGVVDTYRGGALMHNDEITLAEALREAGYTTGLFGKWHLGNNYPMRPQDQGFDECLWHKSGGIGQPPDQPNSYFDPKLWRGDEPVQAEGYCTDIFFDAACEFMATHRDGPFFVYLATNAPHTPLEIMPEYVEPYTAQGLDDTTARVYGMITNIDDNVGRMLEWLGQQGLRDNTLVIFLGDDGPQHPRYNGGLRGRKSSVHEGGIRVPCFVQWPAVLRGKRQIDTMAADIDLLPTILESCHVPPPGGVRLDGVSLFPLLRGQVKDLPDRHLFFQCHRGLSPEPYHNAAAITERYKLVCNPGTFHRERLDADNAGVFELYDLYNDPGEEHNLAHLHPGIVAALRSAYDAWFEDVRASRNFTPGRIQLGSPYENPVLLCRFQDKAHVNGRPIGWSVFIERAGLYELTIDRGETTRAGTLHAAIQGNEMVCAMAEGQRAGVFSLPRGEGMLQVWMQYPGMPRDLPTDNTTAGDVTARFLG